MPEATAAPETVPSQPQAQTDAVTTAEPSHQLYLGAGLAFASVVALVVGIVSGARKKEEKKRGLIILCCSAGALLPAGGRGDAVSNAPCTGSRGSAACGNADAHADRVRADRDRDAGGDTCGGRLPAHFRKASDPEEVVVFDDENGIYEYRSDTLAVEIHRYEQSDPPLAYYVAHIYERGIDSYRSGFGSARSAAEIRRMPAIWRAAIAWYWA